MLYRLQMKFCTDGDFGWGVVPAGFNYDNSEEFDLDIYLYSQADLDSWIRSKLPVLQHNLGGRGLEIGKIQAAFIDLKDAMESKSDFNWELSGNYDGTYVRFTDVEKKRNTHDISVPYSVYAKFCQMYMDLEAKHMDDEIPFKVTWDSIIQALQTGFGLNESSKE